ncbi:MAG: hypothetical protein HY925_11515 [Elusimicrobia bacterium]|nr:hypothetical protein [Elusimicrobiota bacterium]
MADTGEGKNKVFVAGLPWATNQNELYELVKPCGKIVEAKIILDRGTGKSKGFAFIEMASAKEANAVIEKLNGSELGGRTLFATEFKKGTEGREPGPRASAPSESRPAAGPPGGVERRSGKDRRKNPGFGGPAPERREFKKPWEKKPWGDRKPGGFGDRKPWGDRKPGGFGDKKPWDRDRKPSFGDRKPWDRDRKPGFGDKKPWEKKPWDKDRKPGFGDKKPWEKKPWDKDRKPGFGDKKPWEKKPWDKDRKPGFGDKKPWGKKPFGKKPFDRKPGGFRGPKP